MNNSSEDFELQLWNDSLWSKTATSGRKGSRNPGVKGGLTGYRIDMILIDNVLFFGIISVKVPPVERFD
jgi:hypothetical protein